MAQTMMSLGSFQFAIDTAAFQELSRDVEYRWQEQELVGTYDALQYTGAKESITLAGTILPHWRGGRFQVQALRDLAGRAQPLMLIDGTGRVWGQYVIRKVSESQSTFASRGVPLRQGFTIELTRYA